jgi:hypothetical protein
MQFSKASAICLHIVRRLVGDCAAGDKPGNGRRTVARPPLPLLCSAFATLASQPIAAKWNRTSDPLRQFMHNVNRSTRTESEDDNRNDDHRTMTIAA